MKLKYILLALIIGIFLWFLIEWGYSYGNKGRAFVVARDSELHPFNFMGKELDVRLFCDDLTLSIADRMGIDLQLVSARSDDLLPGLKSGLYDAIMVPIAQPWPNVGLYYFSDPLFALGPVLVVRIDEPERSFKDFEGKTIGIVRSSPLLGKANAIPGINVAPYDTLHEGLDNLMNDRIDGFLMDAVTAYLYTQGFYNNQLRIYEPALTSAGVKLVVLQDEDAQKFIAAFDADLRATLEDHSYEALLKKWNLADYPLPPILHPHDLPLR